MSKTTDPAKDKKIQQMVNFIEAEAKENANEIDIEANEEFTIEKEQLVEEGKKKIRNQFELKEKNALVEKQKDQSNLISKVRLEVLKKKDEIMQQTLEIALKSIKKWATENKSAYQDLLYKLALEGLCVLSETSEVNVFCLESDYDFLASKVKSLEEQYTEKTKLKCKVTVPKKFLSSTLTGGVYVCGLNDRIKVDNTLEQRVNLTFNMATPVLKDILFPDHEALN